MTEIFSVVNSEQTTFRVRLYYIYYMMCKAFKIIRIPQLVNVTRMVGCVYMCVYKKYDYFINLEFSLHIYIYY